MTIENAKPSKTRFLSLEDQEKLQEGHSVVLVMDHPGMTTDQIVKILKSPKVGLSRGVI